MNVLEVAPDGTFVVGGLFAEVGDLGSPALVRLTATESLLMRIFSRTPGEPLSRTQLVETLGKESGGEQTQERAVDVQITRLRRKIENDPRQPRYLQTVRGAGYMLAPD